MRDRLIELLDCVGRDYDDYCDECREGSGLSPMESFEEYAADYLRSKGIIVPSVKVGGYVYRVVDGGGVRKPWVWHWKIIAVEVYEEEIVYRDESDNIIEEKDFGETVFITRAEAERSLERSKE